MVYLSNRSVLFSEQYLIAYMEATNRKELSFDDCLFLFKPANKKSSKKLEKELSGLKA